MKMFNFQESSNRQYDIFGAQNRQNDDKSLHLTAMVAMTNYVCMENRISWYVAGFKCCYTEMLLNWNVAWQIIQITQ